MRKSFVIPAAVAAAVSFGASLSQAAVIYLDFGSTNSTTPPWNNISGGAAIPLVTTTGAASGISATQSGFGGGSASGGGTGFTGAAAAAFSIDPALTAAQDYSFVNGGSTGNVAFTGLTAGTTYTFTAYGARNNGTTLTTTYTATGANSASGSLQTSVGTAVNNDTVVVLSNISPTALNTINLGITGSGFSYINALKIEYSVPEPATLAAIAGSGVVLLGRRRRGA